MFGNAELVSVKVVDAASTSAGASATAPSLASMPPPASFSAGPVSAPASSDGPPVVPLSLPASGEVLLESEPHDQHTDAANAIDATRGRRRTTTENVYRPRNRATHDARGARERRNKRGADLFVPGMNGAADVVARRGRRTAHRRPDHAGRRRADVFDLHRRPQRLRARRRAERHGARALALRGPRPRQARRIGVPLPPIPASILAGPGVGREWAKNPVSSRSHSGML